MKKVAINTSFGGFDLSNEAKLLYWQKKYPGQEIKINNSELFDCFLLGDKKLYMELYSEGDTTREDPLLIEVIEELGKKLTDLVLNLK